MEIPLYIDGRQAGSFCMAQSGLYTLLEANADGCAQRLIRLWAHGEGGSAYLGVMQPWRGGLWLRRKLSRRELEHFPAPIAFVSDREHEGEDANRDDSLHNMKSSQAEHVEEQGIESLHNHNNDTDEQIEYDSYSLHNTTDLYRCPWPAALPEGDLLWFRREDGSLVSHDDVSGLLALPEELRERSATAAVRTIEGKKYLVFRY